MPHQGLPHFAIQFRHLTRIARTTRLLLTHELSVENADPVESVRGCAHRALAGMPTVRFIVESTSYVLPAGLRCELFPYVRRTSAIPPFDAVGKTYINSFSIGIVGFRDDSR